MSSSRQKVSLPTKLGTVAILGLGLLIAGTVKASEERVITVDAIGASLFSDAELLTSLANQHDYAAIDALASENRCKLIPKGTAVSVTSQRERYFQVRLKGTTDAFWVLMPLVSGWDKADSTPGPGESRIIGPHPGYTGAFSLSDEKILMSMKGDFEAIQGMLQEGRCRIVMRGTAVVVLDQDEDFVKVRIKGSPDAIWLPKDRVGDSDEGPTPTPSLAPASSSTPSPAPMTDAERKEMEAGRQQFKDADRKERELLRKQEEQRKAQYEAEHEDPPVVIGAKPAPQ